MKIYTNKNHVKDFVKGIKIPKVTPEETEALTTPLSQYEVGALIKSLNPSKAQEPLEYINTCSKSSQMLSRML